MLIAIPAENDPAEGRVAATPETVKEFVGLGAEVKVQTGAGLKSGIPDQEYILAGAVIAPDTPATVKNADIVLRVRRPRAADIAGAKQGAAVVAIIDPYGHIDALNSLAAAGVCAFAMELMPRITRAQTMDVLSSQANIAGYRAVIDAAAEYGRVIPMMMTAAGMIPPAKIFIMGVGVAGLQAIATARKLGAIVTATDVRPATKEQVVSLGAKFIAVEDEEFNGPRQRQDMPRRCRPATRRNRRRSPPRTSPRRISSSRRPLFPAARRRSLSPPLWSNRCVPARSSSILPSNVAETANWRNPARPSFQKMASRSSAI